MRSKSHMDALLEGKKYLLTSQWYKKGLPNLLSWLVAHGLSSDRIKALS